MCSCSGLRVVRRVRVHCNDWVNSLVSMSINVSVTCLSNHMSAWSTVTYQVGVVELVSLEAHHLRLHHVEGVAVLPHAHARKHTCQHTFVHSCRRCHECIGDVLRTKRMEGCVFDQLRVLPIRTRAPIYTEAYPWHDCSICLSVTRAHLKTQLVLPATAPHTHTSSMLSRTFSSPRASARRCVDCWRI